MTTIARRTSRAGAILRVRRSHPVLIEVSSPCRTFTSIVFVVDDDVSVRESLELLIRTAGWQPETFASAQEFLSRPLPHGSVLPGARRDASGTQRP